MKRDARRIVHGAQFNVDGQRRGGMEVGSWGLVRILVD